jgi:ZIP family zinc transporter
VAIALHNIPEGMAVAAAFQSASNSSVRRWDAIKWSILSGLCEPLGALIFALIFSSYIDTIIVQSMMSAVAGIMVYISLVELIPSSLQYLSPEVSCITNTSTCVSTHMQLKF